MEKLSMCRICLLENDSVHYKVNKNLQGIYEELVGMGFETEDSRPVHLCYICSARLWNCYRLKSTCLKSEQFFTQVLQNNKVMQPLEETNRLKIMHCNIISILPEVEDNFGSDVTTSYIDIKIEPLEIVDAEQPKELLVKEEYEDTPNNYYNTVKYEEEDRLALKVDDHFYNSEEGLKQIVKVNDESLLASLEEKICIPSTGLGDLCSKTVKVVLHRLAMDDSELNAAFPKTLPPHDSSNAQKEIRVCPQKDVTNKILAEKLASQKVHKCQICGRRFIGKFQFKQHVCTEGANKPFECNECAKRFTTKSQLTEHIHTHGDERPYRCDICGKCYKQTGVLNRHKLIHTREKRYECKMCGVRFNRHSNMRTHMRSHTGDKPYECSACGKRFSQRSALNRHYVIHTGEKPFECQQCGKRYNDQSSLSRHTRTHSGVRPYECSLCGNRYMYKFHFDKHVFTHTGEKPFECNMCGTCFNRKSHLTRHILRHAAKNHLEC